MSGFRTAIKNVRLKSDPDGRVHLVRVHKIDASKRKRVHVQAKREADKWKDKSK
ncbi:MAG: hypothetical protein HOO99_13110 [Hyphomicrobiaceae bacterium]|nr:hypothetical protein [Hyphomicrobiaceae bacterium]